MGERACRCVDRGGWFYGDHPLRSAELGEGVSSVVLDEGEGGWRVRCPACGTIWRVDYLSGGGVYADFHWSRETPSPGG